MKIAFNPSTVAALTTPPNNKDITFDLRGRNIFARGVKFYGTDTNTWRDIKINNVSIGSHTLDLRNGSNTTLTNTNGVVTINSIWRPVVDNLTSDSTTSSLSAKQGKVLKTLIDGKSNSDHNHDGRYLKLTGGTMASNALITFADSGSWDTNKGPQGARGGLCWTGQSDYAKLYAEETVGDNLDLVIQFGNDNSNGLSIRNKANTQTSYISSSGVITTGTFKGNLDWSYITNKPSSYTPSAHTHAWNSLTHSSTTENQAILTNGKANGWKLQTLNIARWDNAANNAHSHANKSVLDGITSALVNSWNTAYNFVSNITGTDTDKVINKWEEIVNFLAGITEDNKLNTLLNSKLSIQQLSAKDILTTKTNNALFWVDTKGNASTITTGPFTDHPYALLSVTNYNQNAENYKFFYRSRLAFSSAGDIKVASCHHENEYQQDETWYNVLTSKNSGINGSTIKLNGTSITVYSSGTADGRYVKKSGDTMQGVLTIDTTNFGALTIKRNDDANGASILFRGKSSVYGYIGLNNSTKDKQFLRWSSDTSRVYTILDTSSTYIYNGKGVINGTTITQVDNATNSTNSTNARKLVNWYSARPTSLNAQFGDGSLRIFYATSSTTEGKPAEDSHILHLAWDNTGGWDAQLAVHTRSGKVSTRAQNGGTWQPWKTLAFTTDIPTSLKNPYSFNVFGVVYDGSAAKTVTTSTFISQVTEGTSTITDGTMLITSYASNSGFADTNAVNVPYKRKAIHLWEYIKAKTDSLYATKGHNHDGKYLKLTGGTMLGALNFANNTWNLVGDDSYIGDCNISGHFGIKAANTTYPGITFFNNASTFLGNLTAYSGNIKYGAYSLQFLDNGNTSVSASTWTNPFSNYNSNAVADGQAICVWGQGSYLSNLSTDTGNMSLWLKRINANGATLNMVLDGEYYANGNQRLAHVSEIPNKDSWNYDDRYLRLTGGWMSGDINFGGDNKIYWGRNTDSASISFKNDGDGDANSYMSFVTSDNGNEYFRWSHSHGSTNTEWMALRSDGLRVRGTKVSLEGHTHDDRYYTKVESNAKYITDIATSVNKLTFTRNGSNIARNITVNVVYSQGQLTNIPNNDATTKASPGLFIYDSYNQVIGTNSYSSVLSITTGGTIQIAGNWGDDQARNLYWRSQSDRAVSSYPWKSWRTILDSENYSSTLDSRYYTESEVNSLLSKKLNTSDFNWTNLPGKLVAGNEFNIVNAGFNAEMVFNYLPINNRNSTATVRGYHFGNGAKGYASVQASGFIKTGSSSSYVLLGDGGHKLEGALNVANADTVDGYHYDAFTYKRYIGYNRNGPYNIKVFSMNTSSLTWGAYYLIFDIFSSGYSNNRVYFGRYEVSLGHWNNTDKNPTVYSRWIFKTNSAYDCVHVVKDLSNYKVDVYIENNLWDCIMGLSIIAIDGFKMVSSNSWVNLPSASSNIQIINTTYLSFIGNSSSATKLQTARKLWGQSFDGTADVSGTLFGVTNIQFSANNAYDIGSNSAASRYIYTHWLGAKSGSKLELGANNSEFGQGLCIDTNLNVGIGTNSPAYKLHVNGTFRATNSTVSDLFVNTGDATLKIYTGITAGAQNDGNICFQTSIDATDGQSHAYPTEFQNRCNIVLQPRGGQVYIGTNPGIGNTTYKLYVNSKIFSNGGFVKNGSSDSYVLLGGGGHTLLSSLNGSHNHDGRYVRAFGTSNDNINSDWGQSFKTFDPIPSGTPPEQNPNISILNIGENFIRRKQLAFIWNNDNIYYRRHTDSGFTNWRRLAFLDSKVADSDKLDGVHLNGIFTGFSYAQSRLTATIGTVSKTVNVTGSYPSIGGVTMNTIASYGNCMGMADLASSNSNVNPNNQTSWHHFINMSYNIKSTNMWQTQFAIKAGTTEVWVRSRAGGSISDSSAWAAPWVRLARITDNIASATNADMVDGEHASSFVRAGHYESNDLNKLDTYSFIRSVNSNVSSTSPKGNTGWYNVIQLVHRNGANDGPSYIGQIALGMTTNTNDMFFRGKRTDPWKTVIHSGNIGSQSVNSAQYLRSLGNQNCQTGRTQAYGDVYTYNTITGNTGSPTTYSSVIGFGRGIAGTVEIAGGWCNTHLYWRSLRDCCEDWFPWRTVLDSGNYTEFINNYYWANVKISASSSTTTSPTVSNLTATNSIRMGNILLGHTDEINNSANGGIHLNYRNSGNVSLCQGGGSVGIGTMSPAQKLDVHGNIRATGQLYLPTNGNYNAILMGDDCWMGDCNISNVIGLSGTNNANSGGIKFGKGGMYIGYNGSSHYSSGTSLWTNFNADTVDGEHASNFSYTHQSSFDFSKRKSGRIVTFDQSGTDYGWINGFASTHNNYLTSVIFNTHRTSNWYVGYMEGNMSTGETNGLQAVHKLAFADGDESYPIFLGYLNLYNGDDGTISSSFPCLGYSVPFTYTRGGAYCLINIPNTSFQTFYIKAAIASVHYSGAGMGHWVGNHRGDGAWWLHCDAVGSNAVQVKGFHLANENNDSWWGGNPLYSGFGAAKIITVCLFGHVKYK